MSQNNCCDSQGHWENSSAVGMSVQVSPAVTLRASGPSRKNSLLHSNSPHLLIISNRCPMCVCVCDFIHKIILNNLVCLSQVCQSKHHLNNHDVENRHLP